MIVGSLGSNEWEDDTNADKQISAMSIQGNWKYGPVMEVRPRRVGGATYQVPMEVPVERRTTLAMRWLIDSARARSGKSFAEKLSAEILDASNNLGAAVKKREETHKMAEANRAFSHYRM